MRAGRKRFLGAANIFGGSRGFYARRAQAICVFRRIEDRRAKFCANCELRYTEVIYMGYRHAVLRGMRRAQCGDFPRGAPVS